MKHFCRSGLAVFFILSLIATASFAQTNISGTVTDGLIDEPLAGVNIVVKGSVTGTISDVEGRFNLKTSIPTPFTLVFSFVGYKSFELQVTNASTTGISVKLEEQRILGQEIVVSASRVEESIMESPVSIEKMDLLAVQNTPADNYYKAIANLKGVDVATSSINFQIINTRGFGSTGNTRFVQLTDGMDTQAPALNFPIGNLNGPSELDVESVELIPGAASALYGPNAFNGVLLVNSKSPFEYQGLSAFSKLGINHVGKEADYNGPAPLYEFAIRYAKAFNNKFAFKVNWAYMKAQDWQGTDATDREIARTPQGLSFNPGADRLHYMGDEAAINLAIFRLSSSWNTFASTSSPYYNNIFEPGVTAKTFADAGDLPSHVVSVTPYKESDLIDYNAKNMKLNAGLYYRLTEKVELSLLYNGGFGTSIYTGAQRYSLSNFRIDQYRLQVRGDNFYARAYTTMENSGDSYITEFLAKRINDIAVNKANPLFADVSGYLATYGVEYLRYLHNQGFEPGEIQTLSEAERLQVQTQAHNFARGITDGKYILDPTSAEFKTIKDQAANGTVPKGPKFDDKTNLYHAEFQYDFKNQVDFMELQVGGSYRMFDLNSNGTIFDDGVENITIKEYGGYLQAGKWLGDRKVKLSGSVRYDKNENFKGRINPRISAVYKAGDDHNIRLSYQTGFRVPSTQGQHIDLNIISARLLGGLPRYAEKYDLVRTSETGQVLSFNGAEVQDYRNAVFNGGATQAAIFNPANTSLLSSGELSTFNPVKPEQVQSIEIGYKGLLGNNFMIDAAYFYNLYNDFITQIRVVTAAEFTTDQALANAQPSKYSYNPDAAAAGTPNYATILNGTAMSIDNGNIVGNTAQIYSNIRDQVTSQGAVLGLTYNLAKGYTITSNYSWNILQKIPPGFLAEFNTPEHKVNLTVGNRKLTDNIGFNVTWRWQDEFEWQSSFTVPADGIVPSYNTVDAQVSYKIKSMRSMLKLGGSNILNKKYFQSLGGPNIGALYYISITFDQLTR